MLKKRKEVRAEVEAEVEIITGIMIEIKMLKKEKKNIDV